ncbi:MAG: dicarboxylate/amino acid:cation symporter [Rickettsiales bacterium]|nr:dicarboxylate/amino acid:cation symporter [Rickettsiales bacterium]
MKFWKDLALWKKITVGLVAGIVVGIVFGEDADVLKPIGDIFIRLIRMIIIPLIYVSIVMGMTSINDSASLSRIALKSIATFLLTTSFAIVIGLATAHFLKPGMSISADAFSIHLVDRVNSDIQFEIMKLINDTIPDNALNALVSGKMLQVVFFSFFTGVVINGVGKEKKLIVKGFKLAAKVIFRMIDLILKLAPYGAFALTSSVVGKQGIGMLQSLGMLVVTLMTAMVVQYIVFGVLIAIVARLSPFPFYKKSLEYQSLAFSTSSSKATLSTTMRVCAEKLGVSRNSTSFVLPLGAAINMDGMAIYLGICTLFFAQIYGINLTTIEYMIIILTSTLGSIGAAGIPSGTIIMLPMVLSAVNIPIEGIALIAGIDRILDMMRTTLNITGDAAVTLLIDRSEGTLDEKIYYASTDKLDKSNKSFI